MTSNQPHGADSLAVATDAERLGDILLTSRKEAMKDEH
jgi:hypothetical protein